ncbi:hypothetical protein JRJ22_15070 [Paenibacillus tianjinensis]|uniref:Uncharacterized protein n=1 Tax=Paenibacillus tianjinensis TaxID=2810347 RepID=A0ABX7LI86_9BACL|nr:hypothetical protein JRJ22_15070 [Paenibacillus tianjinensis]
MSNAYKVLKTDAEFLAAALSQKRVTIFETCGDLAGCIVDYGGPVRKWSRESVKIADAYYLRGEFEFRMLLA